MPVKKELCRNFQRGSCQFGQRCKFLHVNPQQQRPNNVFGGGAQSGSFQPQKPNPYGFGVQNTTQQKPINKPFENTWTRFSPVPSTAPSSRQSESQGQANHKCTDPESCRRIIVEDFEQERPLWKLSCYGHWKNAPCDIVGDISYEELRAAAYDDAKRGLSFQSIVERERNLLSSKLQEFENICKPHAVRPGLIPAILNTFPGAGPNAFSQTPQSSTPTSVSSFSQLDSSLNMGFGLRPPAPTNNAFVPPSPFVVSSQTSSASRIKTLSSEMQASPFTSSPSVFGNKSFVRAESNLITPSPALSQIPGATNNPSPGLVMDLNSTSNANGEVQQANHMQSAELSGVSASIWLKTKWVPGEIPEEPPPDAVCS